MNFRVATWNILWRDRDERLEVLLEHLRAVDADVIFLQESSPEHARTVAAALGMHAVVNENAYDQAESPSMPAVLTKLRGIPVLLGTGKTGEILPIAGAELSVAGRRVRLFSAHIQHTQLAGRMGLDTGYLAAARGNLPVADIADETIRTSVQKRLQQLAAFQAFRESSNEADVEIMGGDFNCVPDGIEYNTMIEYGFRDSWRAGPRLGHGTTILERNPLIADGRGAYSHVVPDALPGSTGDLDYTLDFQFHTGNVIAGRAWTIGEPRQGTALWPSDHLGIVVDYSL